MLTWVISGQQGASLAQVPPAPPSPPLVAPASSPAPPEELPLDPPELPDPPLDPPEEPLDPLDPPEDPLPDPLDPLEDPLEEPPSLSTAAASSPPPKPPVFVFEEHAASSPNTQPVAQTNLPTLRINVSSSFWPDRTDGPLSRLSASVNYEKTPDAQFRIRIAHAKNRRYADGPEGAAG
jgi:hypothetical protein